jgi:ribonuclease BN (tRNA processing enzyme)
VGDDLVRLTVVGCSGSYPGPDSPASCYLVEAELGDRTWRLVLDLGNGALGALHRYADPLTIDAVLLSHLHADHCIDLTSYYVLRKYHPTGARPPIPVYGPDGTPGRLARDADVFLCEASWPSVPTPPPGIHLTGREAGEHATRAGAKRLLLTHLMPFHDPQAMLAEAKETYEGQIDLVAPGAVYSV